jgi:hypothetical protein
MESSAATLNDLHVACGGVGVLSRREHEKAPTKAGAFSSRESDHQRLHLPSLNTECVDLVLMLLDFLINLLETFRAILFHDTHKVEIKISSGRFWWQVRRDLLIVHR